MSRDYLDTDAGEIIIRCQRCLDIRDLSKIRYDLGLKFREETAQALRGLYSRLNAIDLEKRSLKALIAVLKPKQAKDPELCRQKKYELQKRYANFDIEQAKIRVKIDTLNKDMEETETGKLYRKAVDMHREASTAHPKCDGCFLLFGRHHLAHEALQLHDKTYCQYCLSDYKRMGEEKFLERIKVREPY